MPRFEHSDIDRAIDKGYFKDLTEQYLISILIDIREALESISEMIERGRI